MTEEYINGYLQAISRVKDILTPHVGGNNCFFPVPKYPGKTLLDNIKDFMSAII